MWRRHLRAKSRANDERPIAKENPMYPISNPEFHLDLYRQRAEELHREAAEYRMARAASGGRHARSWRRSRTAHRSRPEQLPITP
jgi:hypothetical protein